jgi:hypothetical protein
LISPRRGHCGVVKQSGKIEKVLIQRKREKRTENRSQRAKMRRNVL